MAAQSIKAMIKPTDIAALAVFLASDAGKSISGQVLPNDNDRQRAGRFWGPEYPVTKFSVARIAPRSIQATLAWRIVNLIIRRAARRESPGQNPTMIAAGENRGRWQYPHRPPYHQIEEERGLAIR